MFHVKHFIVGKVYFFTNKKVLYYLLRRSARRTACGPPSPRSRLVKNAADAKLETTSLSAGVFQ